MTTDREYVLQCSGLSKHYIQGEDEIAVISDISLDIRSGARVAIVGASGSGKTTLLNLLGGLDDPSDGSVRVMDVDLAPINESGRARLRNKYLGFVYQFHHLLGEFSALENVAMPLLIGKVPVSEARARANEVLTQVGLWHRCGHKPSELSGGERQRVAIARALVTRPSCVLMDEPTGNLDPATAETVLSLLLKLNQELGISFVVVTHDSHVASQMESILSLENGTLIDVTTPIKSMSAAAIVDANSV
mgnify:CR=1 FL=1